MFSSGLAFAGIFRIYSVGEFGFHAQKEGNLRSERCSFLNSPTLSRLLPAWVSKDGFGSACSQRFALCSNSGFIVRSASFRFVVRRQSKTVTNGYATL